VQVVAGWADSAPAEPVEYDLAGTPCAEVLTGVSCFFPDRVAEQFPEDRWLVDLGVESYAGTPLRGVDGDAKGLLTIMHDRPLDTPRSPCRILDLVAGRAAAELERSRVEEQLRESEAQLREADRRKDEFLAMLAHELRNPLAPIRHALDVQARADGDIEAWKDMRQTMERQVDHLVRLVDDLLDVARLTTGQIALRREQVDLREIVADALGNCRALLEARKSRVTTELSSDPLAVDGDRIRLVQALTNVVNNAAKFTEPGGEINVVAGRVDGAIEIRVRDSGVGIAEERLPRIFDLFSQSDPSPDREHGGLGVGLTLARWLVDLHEGAMSASSAGEGRGSEFRIRLPSATAIPARRHPLPPPSLAPAGASAMHVLIIDDNLDATRALSRLLRVMGYAVTIANDGKSGIDLARQLRPHVILLDIGLPRMDGFAVARHLRSLPDFVTTRIIALTGYGRDVSEQVRAAGIDRHLVKPVDADELQAALSAE
jgi:signal transduction histidine kinase